MKKIAIEYIKQVPKHTFKQSIPKVLTNKDKHIRIVVSKDALGCFNTHK